MADVRSIIGRFGYQRLMVLLDVPYGTVTSWKARGFIPPRHWARLVDEASKLGIEDVTLEVLAKAESARDQIGGADRKVA